MSELMARLEVLRQAIHAERLRRWADEYPPGHADREARRPTSPTAEETDCSVRMVEGS